MDRRIERCTAEQADELTTVAHASKRHWGYPEHYITEWRESLTVAPAMIREHDVWSCRMGEDLAGFYVLMDTGGRMELEHFWVLPEFIGHGIGRYLFEHAVGLARDAGANAIDITSDPNAEAFYEHLGACRVDRVLAPVDGTTRYLPRMEFQVPSSS